jgi:hypothetical protein
MTDRCVIDIGSDIYDLTRDVDIKLFAKGINEFNKAFPANSASLLCKYFKYKNQKYTDIDAEDIDRILSILDKRKKDLESSLSVNSRSEIAKILTSRYLDNINTIIFKIKTQGEEPAIIERKGEISKLTSELNKELITDEAKFNLLLKIAWYMLHTDKISTDGKKQWLAFINEVKKNTEKVLIDNIGNTLKEKTGTTISPLNYFERMKLTEVVTKDTLADTFETAKEKIIEDLRSQEVDKLTNRLQGILAILHLHGYLEGKQVEDILKDASGSIMTGLSNEIITNVGYSLVPIFYYFKKVYDPAYSFVNTIVKENIDIPIDDLLHLVEIGNYSAKTPIQGIIRLENVPERVITFLNKFNEELDEYINEFTTKKKSSIYQQLLSLPAIMRSSMGKAVISRVDRNNAIGFYLKKQIELPTFEEYTTGDTNVINKFKKSNPLKKAQEEKKLETISYVDTYRALTSFFEKDTIYMVIGPFDNFPNNVLYNTFVLDFKSETYNPSLITDALSFYDFYLSNVSKKLNYYINTPLISMMSLIAFNNQLPGVAEQIEKIEEEEEEEKRKKAEEEKLKSGTGVKGALESRQTSQKAVQEAQQTVEEANKPKGILKSSTESKK